jgi:hypothetical protein
MRDAFYMHMIAGSICKNHVFWVEQPAGDELLLCTKLHPEAPVEMQSMALMTSGTVGSATRQQALKDNKLKVIDVPGTKEVKQVEVYTKWRPFVDTPHKETMCPIPKYEVLLRQKAVKVEKAKVIRDKKRNHEEEEGNKNRQPRR